MGTACQRSSVRHVERRDLERRHALGQPREFPPYQQSVESPSPLCYRDSGLMKTDRQIGSRTQHSRKRTLSMPRARPSAPTAFLIANLELEFTSTHRKHYPVRISSRKFLRVFRSDSTLNFSPLVTHHSSLATALLIHGSAIKTPANPQGFNNVQFSNRR